MYAEGTFVHVYCAIATLFERIVNLMAMFYYPHTLAFLHSVFCNNGKKSVLATVQL
jgi:hypothetical protein